MKRVLVITEAGNAWPSGYIRALIYAEEFAKAGIEAEFMSRRSPRLTRFIENPGRIASRLLSLGAGQVLSRVNTQIAKSRTAAIVNHARKADAVYLQKAVALDLAKRIKGSSRARLVYDLNDALWLPHWSSFAKGNIHQLLKTADAVTADNPYNVEYAKAHNPHSVLVPDPPQVEAFDRIRAKIAKPKDRIVVGWVGTAGSTGNLFAVWEALERIARREPRLHLRLIGAGHRNAGVPRFERVPVSQVPVYNQDIMIREVLGMHIGLFPLFDVEDSLARGILKAAVYMAGEVAVVASPVGQNCEFIRHGENGLLARTADEWEAALTELIEREDRRRAIAAAGLQTVRDQFTVARCFEALNAALLGDLA